MAESLPRMPKDFASYFLKQQRFNIYLSVFLAFCVSAGITLSMYCIGQIIDLLTVHDVNKDEIWKTVYPYVIGMVASYIVLDAIPSRWRSYIKAYMERDLVSNMQIAMADYIMGHPLRYFQSDFSGRLAAKTIEAANSLNRIAVIVLNQGTDILFTVFTSVILFSFVNIIFGGIVVLWALIFMVFVAWTVPKLHKLAIEYSEDRSLLSGKLVDALGNMSSVLSYANVDAERGLYRTQVDKVKNIKFKHNIFIAHTDIFKEVMWQLFCSPIVIFMIFQWQKDVITAGEMAMMVPLLINIARNFWRLSDSLVEAFSEYGMFCDAVKTIMVPYDQNFGSDELSPTEHPEIILDKVSFQYEEMALFEAMNFTIKPETKVGLVGPSGAGKSTLINLLCRFYDVSAGTISIDNQNIAGVTQESLRRNIAVIPQDTSLFHRSLMENIRYGRLDASDEDVIDAAKKAHAHEFISELSSGYDTLVGERGVKLSGGQRQRIAIARAILKDAPILILDEATSALDSESEKLIQESLKELMEGKTVIAIAHRLSTIAHLDRLIVMDQGKIIEDGSHKDLLKKEGLYAKLWNMQSGGFLGE